MAYTDKIFKSICRDILTYGAYTTNKNVRAHWNDGSPAYTKKLFGISNMYDLQKEFPVLTLRQTYIKSAIDEVLWIYQKKSNNIKQLKSKIWDQWADENGSIGRAYGYQAGKEYDFGNDMIYDQIDRVLFLLKNEPFSRRMIISLWNCEDLRFMNLEPCCWSLNFNVTDIGADRLILNLVLNQRSNDILTANNWNVVQFSALLMMFAQVSNMIPGKLLHVITDAHIYDRHIDTVKELITRDEFDAPTVILDPDIKSFYDFTPDSFEIDNYKYGEQIKMEVAI